MRTSSGARATSAETKWFVTTAKYRTLLEQAFSKRAMERWQRDVIGPTIHTFVDKFADRGSADLVREFTFPYPVHVITGLLGLPEEELNQFHRWAIELINVAFDPPRGFAASQKLHDYFIEIIEERRESEQGDDLISVLAHSDIDGQRLDNEEICAFLRLLLPAGAETTFRSSGNLLCGLLSNPDQLDAVRKDRSLIPQAVPNRRLVTRKASSASSPRRRSACTLEREYAVSGSSGESSVRGPSSAKP